MSLKEKDLLRNLVRIPSVNPALCVDQNLGGGEARLTEFLENFFEMNRWKWLRQVVHSGRENLVAVCPGGSAAGVMLWEAHQDTVGVEGMSIDPFAATEQDGRIWGRGACDVKGGMAAMLAALIRLQSMPLAKRSKIVLALTVNEECGFTGAKALSQLWPLADDSVVRAEVTGTLSLAELMELKPARAVVAEPTDLQVIVAHKGVVRWRCRTRGRAAHTSQLDLGVNAIYAMTKVVAAIDRFHHEVLAQRSPHPLTGGPSACVSTFHGGTGVNTVPDEAVIDIDRRLAPGETPQGAYQELIEYVAAHAPPGEATTEHDPPWLESGGLDDRENLPWAERVAAVIRTKGNDCRLLGAPYATDAAAIAALGIPTVVFGPGSIAQAHTADEWIDIAELSRAVDIFCRIACDA